MKARYYKIGVAVIALLFVVGFSACILEAVKYTGGGTIPSAEKSCINGETANFGFVLDNCGDEIKGGITYHDQAYQIDTRRCEDFNDKFEKQALAAGVKFTADWTGAADLLGSIGAAEFQYESQNPFCKGDGEGLAWVVDLGEGTEPHGLICLKITSGPFKHYFNCDAEVSGNIQEHECPGIGGY
jgi:hypothetical protein